MMDLLEFTVPGRPVAKERPRSGKHSVYTPRRTHEAEEIVATYAYKGRGRFLEGSLRLECNFYAARHRCDGDNLIKLVADSIQLAGVIHNDSQIDEWIARRIHDVPLSEERTEVRLSRL